MSCFVSSQLRLPAKYRMADGKVGRYGGWKLQYSLGCTNNAPCNWSSHVLGNTSGSITRKVCRPDHGDTRLLGIVNMCAKTIWSHTGPPRTFSERADSVSASRRLAVYQTTP